MPPPMPRGRPILANLPPGRLGLSPGPNVTILPLPYMETSGKSSNELVFIVDDEALLGQLAETLLSEAGYRTRTFLDPEDVLREIRDDGERPALLVTDYVMGTM